jgi:hypothetical protein
MSLALSASWAIVSTALAFIINLPGPGHRCGELALSLISKRPILRSLLAGARMVVISDGTENGVPSSHLETVKCII